MLKPKFFKHPNVNAPCHLWRIDYNGMCSCKTKTVGIATDWKETTFWLTCYLQFQLKAIPTINATQLFTSQ